MQKLDYSQNYERGTLKINPDLAKLSLVDLLATRDLAFGVQLVTTGYYSTFKDNGPGNPKGGEILSKSHSVVRSDTFEELGYGFTDGYNPVSYIDALEGVFGDLKGLGGIPTRLISVNNGARAAIQLIMPESYFVTELEHKLFVNLFAGHDGKQGILFNTADIAIVCGNTWALVHASKELRYSARHTATVSARLAEINQAVFKVQKNAELHYEFLNAAARRTVDTAEIQQFIMALIPKEGEEKTKAKENQRGELGAAIAKSTSERNSGQATAYDLFQGVTRINSYRWEGERTEDEKFVYALNQSAKDNTTVQFIRELL